jgi:ABC-type amino acid transport substrate-binding protein
VGNPLVSRNPSALSLSRRRLLGGLAAGVAFGSASARADEVGDKLDAIMARGTLKIGAYDDFAPYSYLDKNEIKGVDIEVGKIIADGLKVKPEFELRLSGENTEQDLRANVWKGPITGGTVVNTMLRVPYDKDLQLRNDMVKLTGRYSVEKIALAWRWESLGQKPDVTMLRDYKTGVEIAGTADYYLSNIVKGPGQKAVVHFRTLQEAMKSLGRGDIDAVMGPLGQLEHFRPYGGDKVQTGTLMLPGLAYSRWTLCAAVRTNYRDLGYAIDDAIKAAIADGRMEAGFKKYGLSYTPPDVS